MNRISILAVFCVILASACGNKGRFATVSGSQPQLEAPLTIQQQLAKKFATANVVCTLSIHEKSDREELETQDSFTWDLINEYASKKSFVLRAELPDGFEVATFDLSDVRILGSSTIETADGKNVELKNTPDVMIDFKSTYVRNFGAGNSSDQYSMSERVGEQIPTILADDTTSEEPEHRAFTHHIECVIDTALR